jgi:hypothetical protein
MRANSEVWRQKAKNREKWASVVKEAKVLKGHSAKGNK